MACFLHTHTHTHREETAHTHITLTATLILRRYLKAPHVNSLIITMKLRGMMPVISHTHVQRDSHITSLQVNHHVFGQGAHAGQQAPQKQPGRRVLHSDSDSPTQTEAGLGGEAYHWPQYGGQGASLKAGYQCELKHAEACNIRLQIFISDAT